MSPPSDYELIEQGYDPPRAIHPLERVEEIVARCETYQYSLPRDEQRALIASWRERGEALREALDVLGQFITEENGVMIRARAALKEQP